MPPRHPQPEVEGVRVCGRAALVGAAGSSRSPGLLHTSGMGHHGPLRLGIDTGGTCTDAALVAGDGKLIASAKSPTTHDRLSDRRGHRTRRGSDARGHPRRCRRRYRDRRSLDDAGDQCHGRRNRSQHRADPDRLRYRGHGQDRWPRPSRRGACRWQADTMPTADRSATSTPRRSKWRPSACRGWRRSLSPACSPYATTSTKRRFAASSARWRRHPAFPSRVRTPSAER